MNTEQTMMVLVDAHVKASLENFAGRPRDVEATRRAIVTALATLIHPPVPVSRGEVPQATPPKSKRARIFGG